MTRDDIIGTWNITDFSVVDSAGEITKPWGDDIAGLLIYTADGYVSGILGPANSDGKSGIAAGTKSTVTKCITTSLPAKTLISSVRCRCAASNSTVMNCS